MYDAPHELEPVEATRVLRRVFRHEKEQQDEDAPLGPKGEPVDIAPVGVVRDDSGK